MGGRFFFYARIVGFAAQIFRRSVKLCGQYVQFFSADIGPLLLCVPKVCFADPHCPTEMQFCFPALRYHAFHSVVIEQIDTLQREANSLDVRLLYSDAAYKRLNNSLRRRIGTLNCGHSAHPIIMGSPPQYSPGELEQMRTANEDGIMYEGRHYTGYEATQRQRNIESAMRRQKRRILVDEATGDAEKLQADQIRLQLQRQEYARFSKAAKLRTQGERAETAGFSWKQAKEADSEYKRVAKAANSMYDIGSEAENVKAYMLDLPIRRRIQSGEFPLEIYRGRQNKHIPGTREYEQKVRELSGKGQYGPSRISVDDDAIIELVQRYRGTGILLKSDKGEWRGIERITTHQDAVGVVVNNLTGDEADTTTFTIRYSKKGFHIVPDYPSRKGAKSKK
nr:MAG TPA: minor capsid protein [Caudoviricetes sp.]